MMTWNYIKIAPLDGFQIRLGCWVEGYGGLKWETFTGRYKKAWFDKVFRTNWFDGSWECDRPYKPTHWQMLPDPPSDENVGGNQTGE